MPTPRRHVLMTSVRDEGPYILEFVAHHRVLGFDAIHFASNDCRDGTDTLLDALANAGAITHLRNVIPPNQRPQRRAWRLLRERWQVDQADWVMVLDVDEFLFVNHGAGLVGDLTALAGPEIDVIALNALSFGTSADWHWRPGRVTRQFTRHVPARLRFNGPVKSLSRGARWGGLQNHHPVDYLGDAPVITAMRGNGEVMTLPVDAELWRHLRHFPPERISHQWAWYNHYPVKSRQSYLFRQERGNGAVAVGDPPKDRWNEEYWQKYAHGKVTDHRINERYGDAVGTEMARLRDLPGVADAEAAARRSYSALLERFVASGS
ncbi:MAG: glycosyltransferase family 2 protein [Paracoccus sp. (in: a-proteobacteria)]|nr:glycosyltransferase family 2 protein [Paracoccus sp. (in: a-proteobacteria)]